jgi:TolA-binding protein
MLASLRALAVPFVTSVFLAACGGGDAASKLANAPEYDPKDQTKCGVAKSHAKPLIVEWPSPERLELENKVRQGLVVVHYVGCEMSVLDRCSVHAKYAYQGATRNQDRLEMKDEDALYAHLPVGAAGLEATLQRTGRLTVDMNLVGRFEAEQSTVRADELQGDCAGATHFVYGVTVGAFDFYAGGQANVAASASIGNVGARGHSQAERETLTKAGDEAACEKATTGDKSPPEGCGALIRIEVVPLGEVEKLTANPRAPTEHDGRAGREVVSEASSSAAPQWSVPLRDPRRHPQRQLAVLIAEMQQLESTLKAMVVGSKERPPVLRRLAEDYVELEDAARFYQPSTDANGELGRADTRQTTVDRSRKAAIAYYTALVTDYSGQPSQHFPQNQPPAYALLDEVYYYLAYEFEQAGDLGNARRVYLDLITKTPNSKYRPNAYLAFGELFFNEAMGDPTKWDSARQAYIKVIAKPPPENKVYGYAWYRLAHVFWNEGDLPHALDAFKKTIDFGTQFSQLPNAGKLAESARKDVIPVYALAGSPTDSFNFFKNLSGDQAASNDKTFRMMDDLGTLYFGSARYPEAIVLYMDLMARDAGNDRSCYESRIAQATTAVKSGDKRTVTVSGCRQ